jgi:hypothetical protein
MRNYKTLIKVLFIIIPFILILSSCSDWGEWATLDDIAIEMNFDSSSDSDNGGGSNGGGDESSRQGTEYGYKYEGTATDRTDFTVITCGGLLSGKYSSYDNDGFTIYLGVDDVYSDFVDVGEYAYIKDACPDAFGHTFDSIAIAPGYKVSIYSGKNFGGDLLLEETGPAIVYNIKWKDHSTFPFLNDILTQYWNGRDTTTREYFRNIFPTSVRKWSSTDMNDWDSGSIKVEAVN